MGDRVTRRSGDTETDVNPNPKEENLSMARLRIDVCFSSMPFLRFAHWNCFENNLPNSPNPPLLKGGEGGFSSFVGDVAVMKHYLEDNPNNLLAPDRRRGLR